MSSPGWSASMFHVTECGIFIFSEDGVLIDVNPSGCRMHQRTRAEMLELPTTDYLPTSSFEVFERFQETLTRGEHFHGTAQGLRKDGTTFEVEVYGAPLLRDGRRCHLANLREVTERNRLRARLEKTHRMEAMGRLAGGVAHDFNNLLTVIMGNAELASTMAENAPRLSNALTEIVTASEKARDLTRQLLVFGRKQAPSAQGIDLNAAAQRMQRMLRRLIREDVVLELKLQADPSFVAVAASQLDQVLMNLTLNAQDAMPRGGRLTIATSSRHVSREDVPDAADFVPGEYVALTVSDTGVGISPDALPHLFEPFFTTKEIGDGTGLGLATVYGIVKQHSGHIRVESHTGQGSRFEVLFRSAGAPTAASTPPTPIDSSPEELPSQPAEISAEGPNPARPAARARVLVVDDDEQVRNLTANWLSDAGFRVWTASSPVDAICLATDAIEPVEVLLTDVVMPGMDGQRLYQELGYNLPDLRVVYMSGYGRDVLNQTLSGHRAVHVLQKPFRAETLVSVVYRALNRQQPSPKETLPSGAAH